MIESDGSYISIATIMMVDNPMIAKQVGCEFCLSTMRAGPVCMVTNKVPNLMRQVVISLGLFTTIQMHKGQQHDPQIRSDLADNSMCHTHRLDHTTWM